MTSDDIAGLFPEERYALVTDAVSWAARAHPVGIPLFDAAWTVVRAEKPWKRPEDCVLARTLASQFLADLLALRAAGAGPA